jgi:hypothetical protein
MASAWPRQMTGDFEREGDREYMAPEILRGNYGKTADIFRWVEWRITAEYDTDDSLV